MRDFFLDGDSSSVLLEKLFDIFSPIAKFSIGREAAPRERERSNTFL